MLTSVRNRTAICGSWICRILSGSTAHGANSNPIPAAGYRQPRPRPITATRCSVNDGLGLLFMNSANNGSTLGCQIFDLRQNPFNPPVIASWSGSGHDCHDSFARANVPRRGRQGSALRRRMATRPVIASSTSATCVPGGGTTLRRRLQPAVSGIYAHSNWLDNDSHYLYAFEEFNVARHRRL